MLEPQNPGREDNSPATSLKLVKGNLKISIDDFASYTELIQVFKNESESALEVKYTFPLPENAQLKSFEVYKDGKCFRSELKAKDNALEQYDDHIASGGTAYMSELSDVVRNAFDLSIGNFLPNSWAVIKLSWVTPHDFDSDQQTRRIHFPALNMRFSESVTIQPIAVKLSHKIESILSDTHALTCDFSGNIATVTVTHQNARVFKSMQLAVKTVLPEPNYIVEENTAYQDYPYAFKLSVAVQLTKEQREEMKKEREYVFILDCSGSMDGQKIDQAIRGLKLFLASLPANSYFNITRFGNSFASLWTESKRLNRDSLNDGLTYAEKSKADMNGTEVFPPMKSVIEAPSIKGNKGEVLPRAVFLLTDGQFTNQSEIFALVQSNVPRVSVYTIGIGGDVIEGDLTEIAALGRGRCLIVKDELSTALQAQVIDLLQSVMVTPSPATLEFGVPVKLAALDEPVGSALEYSDRVELQLVANKKYQFYGFMKKKPLNNLVVSHNNSKSEIELAKVTEGSGLHTIACGACISQLRSSHVSSRLSDIIVLSTTFGVLSPYTAFVMTEQLNQGTPAYASLVMEGLDLTAPVMGMDIPADPVVEDLLPGPPYNIEIPILNQDSNKFTHVLSTEYQVLDQGEKYTEIPASIVNRLAPGLAQRINNTEDLTSVDQDDLKAELNQHIGQKMAVLRMLNSRKTQEENLLKKEKKKEHVDKIAEIAGVMMKICKDIQSIYDQIATINKNYDAKYSNSKDFMNPLLAVTTRLGEFYCESRLFVAPEDNDLIKFKNFDTDHVEFLKKETDVRYAQLLSECLRKYSPTSTEYLNWASKYSDFCLRVLKDVEKAVRVGKEAFDNAISQLDSLEEDSYKDSTLVMQQLRDQLEGISNDPQEGDASSSGSKNKNVANKATMDKILFMQHTEGSWSLDEVVLRISIDIERLKDLLGDKFGQFSESVLATALVLVWLNQNFNRFYNEFSLIALKAEQYLTDFNADQLVAEIESIWTKLTA